MTTVSLKENVETLEAVAHHVLYVHTCGGTFAAHKQVNRIKDNLPPILICPDGKGRITLENLFTRTERDVAYTLSRCHVCLKGIASRDMLYTSNGVAHKNCAHPLNGA